MTVLLALISVSTLIRECFRDQRVRVSYSHLPLPTFQPPTALVNC